ncbi:2-C-methyl-D-erythritol 4-phosphate cytidylyltransferase [uncultured Acetobacteroides sp.]|uniref:2-C-methyl-D-erythritol 4-phosphate cytidylyltransferase n=1 Tax=uncultured Acetobacteroides sp. TaxID=1760811 RepID=UPI0029F53BA5|nr:2-C-methyl-D-erythritol 4-phosphate cytidylyltransferase [uncultured Acetobacteroides sp.]
MKKAVVIVAGGSGTRMRSDIPKQFLLLRGKPILMHTIERFYYFCNDIKIVVVLPNDEIERWKHLCSEYHFTIQHDVTQGGETRYHSVKNGLLLVDNNCIVGIHDGVRPLVSTSVIERCYNEAATGRAVIPVIPAVDSLRMVTATGNAAIDRSAIRLVQTPQVFPSNMLMNAYKQEYTPTFTDDASVVESYGLAITLVDGNIENIKITNPIDLTIADRVYDNVI